MSNVDSYILVVFIRGKNWFIQVPPLKKDNVYAFYKNRSYITISYFYIFLRS